MARGANFCDGRKAIPALGGARLTCLPADLRGWLRILARTVVLSALVAHGGCSTLPTSGPTNALARADQLDPATLPYAMVKVTTDVEGILERNDHWWCQPASCAEQSAAALGQIIPGAEVLDIPNRDHMRAVGDKVYKTGVTDFLSRRP